MIGTRSKKLTLDETRLHNRRLVLRTIYDASGVRAAAPVSRADIARATGLTRTTSSVVVGELIAAGLVEEIGQGPSAGGKPPTLLRFLPDSRYAIGIDLAGAVMRGGLYDLRGTPIRRVSAPLPEGADGEFLSALYRLIDELIAGAGRPLLGIGVGAPGLMDRPRGVILEAVNRGRQDLPLRDLLAGHYGLPVEVVNDSQAAALAEYTFGCAVPRTDLAVILVGRGISAGLVLNGSLYSGGPAGGAGEIGHLRVVDGGELCTCGRFGCLETVAAERALLRWARTVARNDSASELARLAGDGAAPPLDAILRAFQGGDETVARMVAQLGHYLGIAIANVAGLLSLPCIVLAGSLAAFGEALLDPIRAELHERVLPAVAAATGVRVTALGDDIVMSGAAALLLAAELGIA